MWKGLQEKNLCIRLWLVNQVTIIPQGYLQCSLHYMSMLFIP